MNSTSGSRVAVSNQRNTEQQKDIVIKDIMRGLYEGRYEPGQRITEAFLTSTFNLSRGPAREALNTLAAKNVVELNPGRGAQIRFLTVQEAIDTLIVSKNLIGLAARLAAENRDNASAVAPLALVRASLETLSSAQADDPVEFAKARDAFYGAITQMADNNELSRLLPTIQVHLIRVQFRHVLRRPDGLRVKYYARIFEAISQGEAKNAEKAVYSHLDSSISALQKFRLDNS